MIDDFDTDRDIIENGAGKLECLKCDPTITFNPSHRQRFVEHVGAHILHDKSVDRSLEPCGLCLSPAPLCKFVVTNGKGRSGKVAINMNTSSCLNLIKLSISVAAKCSDASPCTNHPMSCPYCPHSSPAIWSYNFRQHLLRHHPAVSLKKHESIFTLSKLEKDGMKCIWDQRHEQRKARSKTEHRLVISEMHRSARLVLKYVFFIPYKMILIQVVYCSEMEHESESSDEGGLGDDNSEGLISDKSEDNGVALDYASEVPEGGNLGSDGKQYIEDWLYGLISL